MKNIVYRLQFRFEESSDKSETRNSRLTSILSSMEDIDTEKPIIYPNTGSIIEIDGEDFEIVSKKFSFIHEGNTVFYTTIISMVNFKKKVDTDDYDKMKKVLQDYIQESTKKSDAKYPSKYPPSKFGYKDQKGSHW